MRVTVPSLNGTRLSQPQFSHDKCFLKLYGDRSNPNSKMLLKLVKMRSVRNPGIEIDTDDRTINDHKLEANIVRAKNKIFELAFCNHWDLFITATLDGKKYDRTDLEVYHKDFTKWLSNQSAKYGSKISFLLIPELHSDGKTWHMHGFLSGVPIEALVPFKLGDRMGSGIAKKVKDGELVYNWPAYQKKFGFCDLEPIRNHEAVSKYVTKYISKSLSNSVSELNAHLYYRSRNLNEALDIKNGTLVSSPTSVPSSAFSCDYCEVEWYNIEALDDILSCFWQ